MYVIKRRIAILVITILILISSFPLTAYAQDDIKVKLDGQFIQFDVSPVNISGRTMVPMRAIFEKLGYEVEWDGNQKKITAVHEVQTIVLYQDNPTATIIDQCSVNIILDVPPTAVNGRTLVPLRFIAETAGAKVDWDNNTKTAIILTIDPALEISQEIISSKIIFENDIRTFTLYAFMNFTGYDDENNRNGFSEVRKMVRNDLNGMNLKLSDNNYFRNKGVSYGRYREALASLGAAPDFKLIAPYDDILTDLGPKLMEFYNQAGIEQLYEKYKPYYDRELEKYKELSIEAIVKTNQMLRINNSKVKQFYIQVNLLDAYERGSGLGLTDNYKNAGVIITGPAKSPNIENIVHEYLHGVINPVTATLNVEDKNNVNESCIRALTAYTFIDTVAEQKSMVSYETQRGFTLTQYVYDSFQEYDTYQGSLEEFIAKIIKEY